MANEYVDGVDQYGTSDITINAVAYVCESWSRELPTSVTERMGSDGTPIGQRIFDQIKTATATIQVPTAGTVPAPYQTCTHDGDSWVVSSVSKSEESQGIKKCTVQFREVIS